MTHMKPIVALGALLGVAAGLALSYVPAASAEERPAQNTCISETHTCSSGSCSRAIPDGGIAADAGVLLGGVKAFSVRVCGTAARPLGGAGTLKDYHCDLRYGVCPEVTYNAQSVTSTGICNEFPPFVIPASLPSSDRMVWASSGVTIVNWDAGAADVVTVTVCPAQ